MEWEESAQPSLSPPCPWELHENTWTCVEERRIMQNWSPLPKYKKRQQYQSSLLCSQAGGLAFYGQALLPFPLGFVSFRPHPVSSCSVLGKPHWILDDHLCHSTIICIYMAGWTLQIQSSCSNNSQSMRKSHLVSHPILPRASENKWVLKVVLVFDPQLQWPGYVFVALWGFQLEMWVHGGVLLGFSASAGARSVGWGRVGADLTYALRTNQQSWVLPDRPLPGYLQPPPWPDLREEDVLGGLLDQRQSWPTFPKESQQPPVSLSLISPPIWQHSVLSRKGHLNQCFLGAPASSASNVFLPSQGCAGSFRTQGLGPTYSHTFWFWCLGMFTLMYSAGCFEITLGMKLYNLSTSWIFPRWCWL